MPMISQLPVGTTVTAADEVPISQDGSVCAVSVGALLASTQPSIIIPQGALLGRTSIGSGGPEGVEIGVGIDLADGKIVANGADHAGFPFASGLLVEADLVVSDQGNQMLMPAASLRGLFTAGKNISIDANGVISSSASGGSSAFSISSLQATSSVIAADIIPVAQNGTAYAVSYSNFLNGLTIDQAPIAAPASDSDTVWVAQGSNAMGAQTLGAIWTWIANGFPRYRPQVLEIAASITLSYASHNGRMLVVTAANVTITPNFTAMGSGFYCDIVTNGSGSVIWGGGIVTTNAASSLPSGSHARLLACTCSTGNIVMASVGSTASSSSTSVAVPGSPPALATSAVTTSSVSLTWAAPGSGGTPTGYLVEYSLDGGSTWSQPVSFGSITSGTVTGLSAATTYAFRVAASNAAGTSAYAPASSYPTTATATTTTTPGVPTAVTFTAVSSTGMTVQWTAPSVTVTSYNLQYRVWSTSTWTVVSSATTSATISGLTPATTYEFQVQAVNGALTSPYATSVTNATATTNTGIYKLTPAPTRQSPTMGWVGTTIVMANGQPGLGYNVGDNSGASDGSHPVPAAVGFAWSSSNTVVPAVSNAGAGGLALDGHNLWYTWAVTYPSAPGNYYLWAIAKDSSGNVGGTCVSPTPFMLQ